MIHASDVAAQTSVAGAFESSQQQSRVTHGLRQTVPRLALSAAESFQTLDSVSFAFLLMQMYLISALHDQLTALNSRLSDAGTCGRAANQHIATLVTVARRIDQSLRTINDNN